MKKIVSLAVVLIFTLSLAACVGNTGNGNNNESNRTSPPASQGADNTTSNGNAREDASLDFGDPQGSTNLVPIGTTASATFTNRSGEKHSVSICVEETIRGDAALSFINDYMMASKTSWVATAPDEADQEYIVVKLTYTLLQYDVDDSRSVSFFYAYNAAFEDYPSLVAAMFYDKDSYPRLSGLTVDVGQTVTAYEIFQISTDDPAPVISYACNLADLSNGLWFKLN